MAYSKTNWQDLPSTTTPLNATNLNKIENELEVVDKSLKYIGEAPSDLNDAKTFGIYHLASTYTNAPISETMYGILIVYQNKGTTWNPPGGSWIWQEIRLTNGRIYTRYAVNTSNSWSNWMRNTIDETYGAIQLDSSVFSDGEFNYDKKGNMVNIYISGLKCINPPAGTWKEITVTTLPVELSPKNFYVRSVCRADANGKTYILNVGTNGRVYITDRGTGDLSTDAITGYISYISN